MSESTAAGRFKTASLAEILERVGVFKSSVIRVTGPSSLSALVWFCRHGFERVGYVRPGDDCLHEEPDAIIVAHPCNELDLKRLLNVGRQVRPGGVFIFQVRSFQVRSAADASPFAIDGLLQQAGFATEQRLERGRRDLIVARRRTMAFRKAA
jgi:hypothetical protein